MSSDEGDNRDREASDLLAVKCLAAARIKLGAEAKAHIVSLGFSVISKGLAIVLIPGCSVSQVRAFYSAGIHPKNVQRIAQPSILLTK